MYCPSCGKQIPDNSAFCSHCGKPTTPSPPLQPVTEWEYKDFSLSWPPGTTGWISAHHYTEPAARLDYWHNYQSAIMPELQPLLDDGWQPLTEIGPACIQLRYYKSLEGQSWFWLGLGVIASGGLLLLVLPFMRTWKYQMVGFQLRLRRPKGQR